LFQKLSKDPIVDNVEACIKKTPRDLIKTRHNTIVLHQLPISSLNWHGCVVQHSCSCQPL